MAITNESRVLLLWPCPFLLHAGLQVSVGGAVTGLTLDGPLSGTGTALLMACGTSPSETGHMGSSQVILVGPLQGGLCCGQDGLQCPSQPPCDLPFLSPGLEMFTGVFKALEIGLLSHKVPHFRL